jgi:hypothetical protein
VTLADRYGPAARLDEETAGEDVGLVVVNAARSPVAP